MIFLKDISKYFNQVHALNSINTSIDKGLITLLIGGNGSGKSTLAKIISGDIKPTKGDLIINGKSYKYLTHKQALTLGISEVYQDFSLDDQRNVYENIFMGQEFTNSFKLLKKKEMIERTFELYEEVGITPPKLQTKVRFLSGGQRQIVAILKVLQRKAKFIIFDEPTSSLGIKESKQVEDVIRKLNEAGITILIISHDIHQISSLADNIIELEKGNLVGKYSVKEYKENLRDNL